MEKDLVLDVALRLGALITKRMGAEVVYTRSKDEFIPLEERTKIANDQKADLFISIHANSSSESSVTGVETYYFNLSADKNALDLATRENATAASSIFFSSTTATIPRVRWKTFANWLSRTMCS